MTSDPTHDAALDAELAASPYEFRKNPETGEWQRRRPKEAGKTGWKQWKTLHLSKCKGTHGDPAYYRWAWLTPSEARRKENRNATQ